MVKRRFLLRAISISTALIGPGQARSARRRWPYPALPPDAVCRIVRQKSLPKAAQHWGDTMDRIGWSLAWALTMMVGGIAAAPAQTAYPNRPVKIIVPIGPGGSYDLVGRQVADALSKRM